MSNIENGKKIYSNLNNCYNTIVSFTNLTINDKKCLLGLDTKGILYIWEIKREYFSIISNTMDDLLDFSDHKVYFPEIAFDITPAILTLTHNSDAILNFTKLQKLYDEFLIITGNFNTVLIKKEQIESRLSNTTILNQKNLKNVNENNSQRIEIKNIDFDIALNDLSECSSQNSQIISVEIDYVNHKIFSFSSNGEILKFAFDVNNLGTFYLEKSFNSNIENYYENSEKIHLTTSKLLGDQNKLVCGTNKSSLIFIDSRSLKLMGIFNILRNKYYEDESVKIISEDEDFEEDISRESVNCIAVSNNCIVIIQIFI